MPSDDKYREYLAAVENLAVEVKRYTQEASQRSGEPIVLREAFTPEAMGRLRRLHNRMNNLFEEWLASNVDLH